MKLPAALYLIFLAAAVQAQTPTFHPLHVSAAGIILDDNGNPVLLRGLNRSGTGSGNAEATATDGEYAAQNQLLSMNLVRLFVNATWWNSNVQVPIASLGYQAYIDGLIQRAKKYGNYVLIVKAGNFPDPPCGANGQNCPAPNQGDLNCQASSSLCAAQDTTGNTIDAAFAFWASFAKKYAADPAVLYDTWEDMHSISAAMWSDDQNQLIAAIRSFSPQSLIFVEDIPGAFESIASGALADFAWSNLVWNFQIYNASTTGCTEPASPRYANWPQNFDPLVVYARQNGHGAAITEWGGCNDADPYHTNITSYAQTRAVALAYFDSGNLIAASGGSFQLTATGSKVAQAYTAIAAGGPASVVSVSSASYAPALAPEAIASAYGTNLAAATQSAGSPPLATNLAGTSVTVTDANGVARLAELFYVSPSQVSYEVPPGVAIGAASVAVAVNGDPVAFGTAQIAAIAPGLYSADSTGKGVAAAEIFTFHNDGTSSFVYAAQYPCATPCAANPIDLGAATDQVVLELFGTGIRGRGSLAGVSCKIGGTTLPAAFAGAQGFYVGLDQVNVFLPRSLRGSGNVTVTLTVDGQAANAVTLNIK